MWYAQPTPEELQRMQQEQAMQDSIAQIQFESGGLEPEQTIVSQSGVTEDRAAKSAQFGLFQTNISETLIYTISTDLYEATFTNLGAGPNGFVLKKYLNWNGQPIHLIADTLASAYTTEFVSTQNYNIETGSILFKQVNFESSASLSAGESKQLQYDLTLENGQIIRYTYTFFGDSYTIGLSIDYGSASKLIGSKEIDFSWRSRLRYTEKSRSIEAKAASADIFAGDEHEQLMLTEAGRNELSVGGKIDWIATKNKFFTQIIKPLNPTDRAIVTGEVTGSINSENVKTHYTSTVTVNIPDENRVDFKLYIGPLKFAELEAFEPTTTELIRLGYSLFRIVSEPIVKWVIIPFFEIFGTWLGNYGLAIILFAILIKLVLYPLTKKSFEGMAGMKTLGPKMQELKEKYPDDPQKQQQAMMRLYKEEGVNPLGGCLPNLLQFPILITLWTYFQNSILIRQKDFLWATDLSAPDIVLSLPFSIPFMGDHIGGFVTLMAASMIVQMKISGQANTNPSMKFLPYIMPFVLFIFFNNLASGLSLYYLIYNVMSIGQQAIINKNLEEKKAKEKAETTPNNRIQKKSTRKKKAK